VQLAKAVGPAGRLVALDGEPAAVAVTSSLVAEHGPADRVEVVVQAVGRRGRGWPLRPDIGESRRPPPRGRGRRLDPAPAMPALAPLDS
jgi:hypothetical protein